MKTTILIALLLCAGIASANDSVDPILDRLAKVDRFAFGGVGYAGITSRGEKDYRLIFARTSAEADFEKLLAVGNPQAKAYALVGIRTLDRKRFERVFGSFRDSIEDVVTQSGCIVDHQSLSAVIKRIAADQFSMYSRIPPLSPEPGITP